MAWLAWMLWLAAAPAGPSASVSWSAPGECPSAAAFDERVEVLRGDASLGASFAFEVRRAGRGELELRSVGHEARYFARSCEALVDTALLLVSLTLIPAEQDDGGGEANEAGETTIAVQPSAADLVLEAEDVAPYLRPDVRRDLFRPRWEPSPGRVLAELGVGALLTPTPAAELFVGAGPRGDVWMVDLGLLARPLFAGSVPEPGVGARLSTWGGLVRTCVGGRLQRVGMFGCGGLELALISARPVGEVENTSVGRRPWLTLELGPELDVRVSQRVALTARVTATYLALRPNFEVSGAGSVCCARDLGVAARVGVEFGVGR